MLDMELFGTHQNYLALIGLTLGLFAVGQVLNPIIMSYAMA